MQFQRLNVFELIEFCVTKNHYFLSLFCNREEYQGILTYLVPTDNIRWSSIFGIMENAKKMLKIEDYSISQNSLEQVVLMFVKDQKDQNTFLSEESIN